VSDRIHQIERFVLEAMGTVTSPDLRIAHDFRHVDRVRGWALRIARGEAFRDLALVEAAALLHDIGLSRVAVEQRNRHGQVGAELAAEFLAGRGLFSETEAGAIVEAVRCHNASSGGGQLGEILRDADKLDALGAVGVMRAFTSKHAQPEYDPENVKGDTWGMPMGWYEQRFTAGQGIGDTIVDQVNFQICFYGDLHTATARRLGKPLVAFMRTYLIQLNAEISKMQK
jgi:HD superfamily phosphodiesterase